MRYHPLTEYTRYGLTSFVESQAVGAQIRIVDLNRHPELSDLGPDFWLFDTGQPGAFAIVMRYEAGPVLGVTQMDERADVPPGATRQVLDIHDDTRARPLD